MSDDQEHARIEIHQTVHGYRDGHELLASSLDKLSRGARRTMLALTDLSGDGATSSFRRYVTGYPLLEDGKYALGCTWYAEEMDRPGCVWTHTLIVAFGDLALIEDLGALTQYFRRPEVGDNLQLYERAVVHSLRRGEGIRGIDSPWSAAFLTVLYGDGRPALVPAEDSVKHEELILSIWSQQWPRLRRNFTFCTGALSPRSLDKMPLDLQIVPYERLRNALRGAPERFRVVESAADPSPQSVDLSPQSAAELLRLDWLAAAVGDLVQPTSGLRDFLRRFGADVTGNRESFRKLAGCFASVLRYRIEGAEAEELLSFVARSFPQANEAATLKASLLAVEGGPLVELPAQALLRWLLGSQEALAFDVPESELLARVRELLHPGADRFEPSFLRWLLREVADSNYRAGRCLDQLVSSMDLVSLNKLFMEDRALFVSLIRVDPSLTTRIDVWSQPREFQRACLEALGSSVEWRERRSIVRAVIGSTRPPPIGDLFDMFGDDIVAEVLDVSLESASVRSIPGWSSALAARSAAVCVWLAELQERLGPASLLVAELLGPRDRDLHRLGTHVLLRCFRTDQDELTSGERRDLAAFAFAFALSRSDGGELAAASFRLVHDAAMHDALSYRAWRWLSPAMPTASSWFGLYDWDRAEKLRRALVDGFLRHQWEASCLAVAVSDAYTRRRVRDYCQLSQSGRALLRAGGLE